MPSLFSLFFKFIQYPLYKTFGLVLPGVVRLDRSRNRLTCVR